MRFVLFVRPFAVQLYEHKPCFISLSNWGLSIIHLYLFIVMSSLIRSDIIRGWKHWYWTRRHCANTDRLITTNNISAKQININSIFDKTRRTPSGNTLRILLFPVVSVSFLVEGISYCMLSVIWLISARFLLGNCHITLFAGKEQTIENILLWFLSVFCPWISAFTVLTFCH